MGGEVFHWVAGIAILDGAVNGLGITAIFNYREWAENNEYYFMCFAAGVLISVPLLHILPKAMAMNDRAGIFALIGFLFLFFSNRLVNKYTEERGTAFGAVAALGIGIHSFIDGVVYAVTFQASIIMGLLAAIGMVTHEFSEGVITFLVLQKTELKKKAVFAYAFFIAALTTPIGAFVTYPFVRDLKESRLGLLVGLSGGVILYVGASHLLPEATERGEEHSLWAFLGGVTVAVGILVAKTF